MISSYDVSFIMDYSKIMLYCLKRNNNLFMRYKTHYNNISLAELRTNTYVSFKMVSFVQTENRFQFSLDSVWI